MSDETSTPGWDAITAALERVYGAREPQHFGTILKYRLGGPDPLDGVSVYTRDDGGSHFHFVTYGLTELYEKESESLEYSGYGFELTFRLARATAEEQPPMWALNFLQNVARYVFNTGNVFEPGHYMDLNGPIALGRETQIRAIGFADDPELAPMMTPHGEMRFLQIVGLTPDELAAARRWRTDGVLSLLSRREPLLVTDLARTSMLRDPAVVSEIEAGLAKEGSSCGMLLGTDLSWRMDGGGRATLTLGAVLVRDVVDLLPARLRFGRALAVRGSEREIVFQPGDALRFDERDGAVVITLSHAAVSELARTLVPKRGEYMAPSAPALRVVVTPSIVRDRDGNVVETVG